MILPGAPIKGPRVMRGAASSVRLCPEHTQALLTTRGRGQGILRGPVHGTQQGPGTLKFHVLPSKSVRSSPRSVMESNVFNCKSNVFPPPLHSLGATDNPHSGGLYSFLSPLREGSLEATPLSQKKACWPSGAMQTMSEGLQALLGRRALT